MKKSLLLLATVFTLGAVSPVLAQEDNSDRVAEIEAQIAELQAELSELTAENTTVNEGDTIGVLEADDGTLVFKEAYIYDDERSPSGKSVLFIIDYTNTSGEASEPSAAMIANIDAEQESDVQVFDLRSTRNSDRRGMDTYENRNIDLKDGATIEFEYAYELELLDSDIALKYGWRHDNKGETVLSLNPNELEPLP